VTNFPNFEHLQNCSPKVVEKNTYIKILSKLCEMQKNHTNFRFAFFNKYRELTPYVVWNLLNFKTPYCTRWVMKLQNRYLLSMLKITPLEGQNIYNHWRCKERWHPGGT